MKITHVDHVNIVVQDLDTAIEFFELLGMKVTARKLLEGKWVENVVNLSNVKAEFASLQLPDGKTVVELLKYLNPAGDADPKLGVANQIGYRHIAFSVINIEAWHKKLTELGIETLSGVQIVTNYRDKKMFYFKGPEGILLELMEYPE